VSELFSSIKGDLIAKRIGRLTSTRVIPSAQAVLTDPASVLLIVVAGIGLVVAVNIWLGLAAMPYGD
jgi:hypothetical protein